MSEGDKSFMCIVDASSTGSLGGLCAEAIVTGSPPTSFASNTWSVNAANVVTALDDYGAALARSV